MIKKKKSEITKTKLKKEKKQIINTPQKQEKQASTKADEEILTSERNQILEYYYLYSQENSKVSVSDIKELVKIHNFIDLYIFSKLKSLYLGNEPDNKKFEFFLESQLLLDHDDAVVLAENIKNIEIKELSLIDIYSQIKGFVNLFSNLQIQQQTEFHQSDEELARLKALNNKLLQVLLNGNFKFDE